MLKCDDMKSKMVGGMRTESERKRQKKSRGNGEIIYIYQAISTTHFSRQK